MVLASGLSMSVYRLVGMLMLPLLALSQTQQAVGVLSPTIQPENLVEAVMVRVVDGDTIQVDIGDSRETVRLIGIDAPETEEECFADEATAEVKRLLPAGEALWLESDVSERDRYQRLLAYVWKVTDGTDPQLEFVNERLVRTGFAASYPYPPDIKHVDALNRAMIDAHGEELGFWAACDGFFRIIPEFTDSSSAAMSIAAGPHTTCDPSYPDNCIPPPPPDLDCSDIPLRAFEVQGDDPHRLDGNNDGRGCETVPSSSSAP